MAGLRRSRSGYGAFSIVILTWLFSAIPENVEGSLNCYECDYWRESEGGKYDLCNCTSKPKKAENCKVPVEKRPLTTHCMITVTGSERDPKIYYVSRKGSGGENTKYFDASDECKMMTPKAPLHDNPVHEVSRGCLCKSDFCNGIDINAPPPPPPGGGCVGRCCYVSSILLGALLMVTLKFV